MEKDTKGLRRGEDHPKANLTDHEVELVRQLHDSGTGYKKLAAKFEQPLRTVRDICNYKRRTGCA